MFEGKIKREDAIAFFRYSVISPMLEAPKGQIDATAKKLAKTEFNDVVNKKMVTFHYRTIYRYYMNYKKYGFDGLKPKKYKNKETHPSVPDEMIKAILELKEELPIRSARKIVTMLELAGKVKKDSLHVRTVNRILKHYAWYDGKLHYHGSYPRNVITLLGCHIIYMPRYISLMKNVKFEFPNESPLETITSFMLSTAHHHGSQL